MHLVRVYYFGPCRALRRSHELLEYSYLCKALIEPGPLNSSLSPFKLQTLESSPGNAEQRFDLEKYFSSSFWFEKKVAAVPSISAPLSSLEVDRMVVGSNPGPFRLS